MRNTAVAEEATHDHFHLTFHVTIPEITGDEPPIMIATSARHVNRHIVATGPLFAASNLDVPYPMPEMPFHDYVRAVLANAAVVLDTSGPAVTWGTGGKKIKPNLMPQPVPRMEPLW